MCIMVHNMGKIPTSSNPRARGVMDADKTSNATFCMKWSGTKLICFIVMAIIYALVHPKNAVWYPGSASFVTDKCSPTGVQMARPI